MKTFIQKLVSKTSNVLAGLALVSSFALSPVVVSAATDCAATPEAPACKVNDGVDKIGGNQAGNKASDFTDLIKAVINILLFLIGAIAVIMIIIGGLRYVTSGGDQGAVTGAKNTILYAVVGLVIAIMAYAIVNFVVSKL